MTTLREPRQRGPLPRATRTAGALALALVLAALAPRATYACTPAPCIAATPNPVQIASGQTQGTTTLDWNAGPAASDSIAVVVLAGTQQVANYQVQAQGQLQQTVEAGKSYTARLVQKTGRAEQILASVQITVQAGPKIQIPGPDQIGTVKNVRVIPHGTWVELQFTAPFPSQAAVWISSNPPQGNSEQGLQVVRYAPAVGGHQIQHTKKLYGIAPATRYYYLIRTTSQNGLRAHASGELTTLRRFAKVTVERIYVIDDSDELSDGELSFSLHLEGGSAKPGGASLLIGDGDDGYEVGSGATIQVNKAFEVETSADGVELNSTGFDDDAQPFLAVMFLGPSCRWDQPFVGTYSDDACDRSGATRSFSGLGPEGPGLEAYTVDDFQHSVLGESLRFRVHGRLDVYYK
jgi:hypothetical protein